MQVGRLESGGERGAGRVRPRRPSFARGVARCVVAAVAACAAGLGGAFQFAGEQVWWVELARYLPYPVYLLAAGIALVASLWLAWAWRFAALAALALVLTLVMGLELNLRGDAGSQRLSVMTFNVKAYRTLEREGGIEALAWEVALHDADIVVMQDAGYLSHLVDTRPAIRARMFGARQVVTSGQYLIASRLPLRQCRDGDISFIGEKHHYFRCTVAPAGQAEFDLFAAHLLTPRQGLNAARHELLAGVDEWRHNVASRLFQARALARDVSLNPRPVVLAGDLNAPVHSPVVRALVASGLRDAFSTAGLGYGFTYGHSLRPHISFSRIDHVLVSPTFGVAEAYVGSKEASEHRPVVTNLWLKRE